MTHSSMFQETNHLGIQETAWRLMQESREGHRVSSQAGTCYGGVLGWRAPILTWRGAATEDTRSQNSTISPHGREMFL